MKLTLTPTNWYGDLLTGKHGEEVRKAYDSAGYMEARLWTGHDQNGNPVLCFIPEWVPVELAESALKEFPEGKLVQSRRYPPQPRRPRALRANKLKGR